MEIYLRGYYGYKNRGDELLLFGVLQYLIDQYTPTTIFVQSDHVGRLDTWFKKHADLLPKQTEIQIQGSTPYIPKRNSLLVLGGGESMTDARPFPYNGRTYLKFLPWIISQKTVLLGGFGTIKKVGTGLLYRLLIGRSQQSVVREKYSYDVAKRYTDSVVLYHDFAYDVLDTVTPQEFEYKRPYIIININTHIRNKGIDIFKKELKKYQKTHDIYFFPGSIGDEDSDAELYHDLQELFSEILLYDWTQKTIQETLGFVQGAEYGIVARLHIVLLLKYFHIDFTPLVYQEKVQRILDQK